MIERHDLFAIPLFKTKVDPSSYDKDRLIADMLQNYTISKHRNNWDSESRMHHVYNDSSNENYKHIDYESYNLNNTYSKVVTQALSSMGLKGICKFHCTIDNVTINTEYMNEHDHFDVHLKNNFSFYSFVHYISFKNHGSTTWINPLHIHTFNLLSSLHPYMKNNKETSAFFKHYTLDVEEDDVVFFPSFLKHKVISSVDEYPRITSAVNIYITAS